MKFSEDRIRHISHLILDELEKESCVEPEGRAATVHEIKKVLFDYFKAEDNVDDLVRDKIRSLSRMVPEGSREWEVLFNKLFNEEMEKRGFSL